MSARIKWLFTADHGCPPIPASALRSLSARVAAIVALATSAAVTTDARADEPYPPLPPVEKAPGIGLMLGASVGALAPVVFQPEAFDGVDPGLSLSVNAGLRFARYFYLGVVYQHGFLNAGPWGQGEGPSAGTPWARTDYGGFNFVTISSPDAPVAFFTEIGAGCRVLTIGNSGVPGSAPPSSFTESGFEVTFLGLGVEMKLADRFRVVPELTLAASPISAFGFLGLTAYFDFASRPSP